jgi:hypothetical protein
MKGQHINWCCSHPPPKKPTRAHPLEIESYKKQLAEANAKLNFIMKRRAIHKTPQTENDLAATNNLIEKLIHILTPNKPTESIPQKKAAVSVGTQTGGPVSVGTQTGSSESSGSSEASDVSSETENLVGTAYMLLLNRTTEDPEKLAERLNTMSKSQLEQIISSQPPEKVRLAEGQAGVMTLIELQQKNR